jgi:hypothetical protein
MPAHTKPKTQRVRPHVKKTTKPTKPKGSETILAKLAPRHFKIIDLCLEGLPKNEIATRVNMGPRQLENVMNSPSFQHQLTLRRAQHEAQHDEAVAVAAIHTADHLLQKESTNAATELILQLTSDDETTRFRSAESILDRTGYAKVTKAQNTQLSAVLNVPVEQLSTINETLKLLNNIKDAAQKKQTQTT